MTRLQQRSARVTNMPTHNRTAVGIAVNSCVRHNTVQCEQQGVERAQCNQTQRRTYIQTRAHIDNNNNKLFSVRLAVAHSSVSVACPPQVDRAPRAVRSDATPHAHQTPRLKEPLIHSNGLTLQPRRVHWNRTQVRRIHRASGSKQRTCQSSSSLKGRIISSDMMQHRSGTERFEEPRVQAQPASTRPNLHQASAHGNRCLYEIRLHICHRADRVACPTHSALSHAHHC